MSYTLTKQPCKTNKHYRGRKGKKIEYITLHHFAGLATPQKQIEDWIKSNRDVSANYLLKDKDVIEYVEEANAPWTNGGISNLKAVTIEVSNSKLAPNYEVSIDSLQTLIELCADIAKRNKLYPLIIGKTLTYHSMFAPTACPGKFLLSKLEYIADEANKLIKNDFKVGCKVTPVFDFKIDKIYNKGGIEYANISTPTNKCKITCQTKNLKKI